MADFTIDTLQDYLEALCVANTDLQHTVAGKRSFARFQSDEEIQQLATKAGRNILCVTRYHGRAIGHADEQSSRQFVGLRFSCKATSMSTDAINVALDKAQEIMWDFIAKFRKDVKEDSCHALRGIELQNISWDEIPDQPWLENHYGWDITIPFVSYQPQYNAAKWT